LNLSAIEDESNIVLCITRKHYPNDTEDENLLECHCGNHKSCII